MIRPRDIWLLVLFSSGLSFAGYVARVSSVPAVALGGALLSL